jgi:hypothetical protein
MFFLEKKPHAAIKLQCCLLQLGRGARIRRKLRSQLVLSGTMFQISPFQPGSCDHRKWAHNRTALDGHIKL